MKSHFRILMTCLIGVAACGNDAPVKPKVAADTIPPTVRILFPASTTAFDRDSDGLVDLEIRWQDRAGAVNPASLTVRDKPPDNSGLGPDLRGSWTVTRLDSAGAVLEETV